MLPQLYLVQAAFAFIIASHLKSYNIEVDALTVMRKTEEGMYFQDFTKH